MIVLWAVLLVAVACVGTVLWRWAKRVETETDYPEAHAANLSDDARRTLQIGIGLTGSSNPTGSF